MTVPRLAFLGTGWIGRHRMQALLASGAAEAMAICEPDPHSLAQALEIAPGAMVAENLAALLALRPDGLVIATPSALHAGQALGALERGVPVFCQKPLGRDAAEAAAVLDAARRSDRLLAVDFSYRRAAAVEAVLDCARGGALGRVFAADLVFHNAYGPDKPWFYDRAQSGGGCLHDLGSHLVDLALLLFGAVGVTGASARLHVRGEPWDPRGQEVEDHALAKLDFACGGTARIACSWRLHAGQDARIEGHVHGTAGGAAFANIGGSFYDFEAWRAEGTARIGLAAPPDEWGGRLAIDWARQLVRDPRFDPAAARIVEGARVLDRLVADAARHGTGRGTISSLPCVESGMALTKMDIPT